MFVGGGRRECPVDLLLGVGIVLGIAWASGAAAEDVIRTFDARPKFENRSVELIKLYSIDATRIQVLGKESGTRIANKVDFDSRNRLYILDSWEGSISVFAEDGRFLRSFGRKGQGPGEFNNPSMMFIKNDLIHVLHSFGFEFKIVDREGEPVAGPRISTSIENPLRYFSVGDDLYAFSGKLDQSFTHLDLVLRRIEEGRWDRIKILLTSPYSPGFQDSFLDFVFPIVYPDGRFIYPEDAARRYALVEYDREGAPRRIFGRKFNIRPYTDKARAQMKEIYRNQVKAGMKLPDAPFVVRNLFRDMNGNVWVVAGETGEDTDDPEFENTVDVFGSGGAWLYSFKTKFVSRNSVYHDGKIFTLRPSDPAGESQTIDVCAIRF